MLLAEMLILLALFFRCLGKEELQGIYYGEDMAEAVQDPSATQIETEPMRLPAGVYRGRTGRDTGSLRRERKRLYQFPESKCSNDSARK